MVTDEEYISWLDSHDAIRCILADVNCKSNGVEITRRFSSKDMQGYEPIISGGVTFKESISLNSSAGISFGGITLNNYDDTFSHFLDDKWVKRKIIVSVGDVRWNIEDFRIIFNGITQDIDSTSYQTLVIKVTDKMQRLNHPVTEKILGGGTINKDRILPLLFGECFNVTPLLVDPSQQEHMVHNGVINSIIESRDDDVPISSNNLIHKGSFEPNQGVFGAVTASAQGDGFGGYKDTVGRLVEHIVTSYGKEDQRFRSEDIDHSNFEAFEFLNSQAVGLFIAERVNVITAITQLADSIGAQVISSRQGLLRIIKVRAPLPGNVPIINEENRLTTNTGDFLVQTNGINLLSHHQSITRILTDYDIIENGLSISSRLPVKGTIKIGYCKNWTIQKEVTTGIPQDHKDLYSQEWITKTATDESVAEDYKIDKEPVQKDTLLINGDDAQAEADRLLNIFSIQRTIYKVSGYINLINTELGDDIILNFDRFGLDGGKYGIVLSIDIDWLKMRVTLEVLV